MKIAYPKDRQPRVARAVQEKLASKGQKKCPRCGAVKARSEFNSSPATWDRLSSHCKACLKVGKAEIVRRAKARDIDPTAERRFLAKIKKIRNGCWIWRGALNFEGQGIIWYRGRNLPAHVAACHMFGRDVPEGLIPFQICRVPPCANPEHVIFDTVRELSLKHWRDNPFRRNADKTACIYGHPFARENTHHFLINGQATRVCLACYRARHPATKKRPNRRGDAMEPRAAKLIGLLDEAVKRLSPEIREDARTLVLMDILERRVTKATMADAVRTASREAWRGMPDRWRTTSIDAPLPGYDQITLSDVLADPTLTADPLAALELEEEVEIA